ncbi:MAG: hypothetical protein WD690_19130 [Vicinamibacterales bacterium]
MKLQRAALALTVVNLVLLVLILAGRLPTAAAAAPSQDVVPVVRTHRLELVDERGQIRSRLNVEPEGEVVFRLVDRTGTIRVKLGADQRGSGLLLLDEATEPGVHIIARRTGTTERQTTTSVTLRGADGQQRVIKP